MELTLSDTYLMRKPFSEHHQNYFRDEAISEEELTYYESEIYFKGIQKNELCCFQIINNKAITSYFIGIDWLNSKKNKAIYIQPKLNEGNEQLDYIKMLFSLTKHSDTFEEISSIYEIKWEDEYIEIEDAQDHLTPLLVIQFLQVVKQITRKGLKKTYYKVEQNLNGRIKGKVMVPTTVKKNLFKNRSLHTYCSFDEFGNNGVENRLLKKALMFVQRYLDSHNINTESGIANLFNYINPVFVDISDEVSLYEIKHFKNSGIYKDYETGLRLAKLILKRFGYNITNTQKNQSIKTPPFWIDMSKLFELYVLGLLKDEFGTEIIFQFGKNSETYYGQPDFVLKSDRLEAIIDAKYKMQYQSDKILFNEYLIKDIRQLSGYARDNRILNYLKGGEDSIIKCIIIYPDKEYLKKDEKAKISIEHEKEIFQFNNFYKLAVKLPVISV